MEQKENDNNDNLCEIHVGLVIVIIFILLDKGHEAESLLKECLFLLYYHIRMDDSSKS